MTLTGGCLCGTVRYRLTGEPYDTGWCHCRTCQKASGAPAMAFTTVKLEQFVVEKGGDAIGTVQSTGFGERQFCSKCGTSLTIHIAHQADEIDVAAATLDTPEAVEPGFHLYYDSRIPWAPTADDLPRHAKLRPDTRGLSAGQTTAE